MIQLQDQVVLPDTTLCAIVRDEVMNPAGGIVDFVDSTVPFVQEAVIIDTGSVDGTKDALEEAKSKHPNLRVYHKRFKGYAKSRNQSLRKARTKRALVLDADERLTADDFSKLKNIMQNRPADRYIFNFLDVYLDSTKEGQGHNPRLLKSRDSFYSTSDGSLGNNEWPKKDIAIDISIWIKHFRTTLKLWGAKSAEWYDRFYDSDPALAIPSKCPSFKQWKQYNPRREEYR